jgi:hypothetical protein
MVFNTSEGVRIAGKPCLLCQFKKDILNLAGGIKYVRVRAIDA